MTIFKQLINITPIHIEMVFLLKQKDNYVSGKYNIKDSFEVFTYRKCYELIVGMRYP